MYETDEGEDGRFEPAAELGTADVVLQADQEAVVLAPFPVYRYDLFYIEAYTLSGTAEAGDIQFTVETAMSRSSGATWYYHRTGGQQWYDIAAPGGTTLREWERDSTTGYPVLAWARIKVRGTDEAAKTARITFYFLGKVRVR
jgi:hypothetical protein